MPNIGLPYFERMLEDEVYAIEIFPTTGNGSIYNDEECNYYMIEKNFIKSTQIDGIYDERTTLPFCPRWFDFEIPENKYITKYPVIKTQDNGIVAQYEKTIYIKSNGIDIIN